MNFTSRHFFGPQGEFHPIHKTDLHLDYIVDNPNLFGYKDRNHAESFSDRELYQRAMGKGFIRGEYDLESGDEGNVHHHTLSHEAQKTKPWNFTRALRTLHDHYSKNPNSKFQITVLSDDLDADDELTKFTKDVTGGSSYLTSLSDIEKFAGIKTKAETRPVKKISRREIEQKTSSQIGKEPRMGQGDMTKAEWNFWRRKGLGDSYMPGAFDKLLVENYRKSLKEDRAGLEDLWQNPLDPRYPYRPPVSTPADAPKPRPWGHNIVDVGPYNDPDPDFRRPTRYGPNDTLDRYRNPINPPRGPIPIINNPPSWWQGGLAMWLQYLGAAAPFLFTQQAGGGSPRPGFIGNDDQGWYPIPPDSQWGGSDLEWYRDLLGIKPSEFPGLGLYFDQDGNELVPSVDGPVSNQPLELERRRRYPMPSTQERMFY
jgi:hypothetical protein